MEFRKRTPVWETKTPKVGIRLSGLVQDIFPLPAVLACSNIWNVSRTNVLLEFLAARSISVQQFMERESKQRSPRVPRCSQY